MKGSVQTFSIAICSLAVTASAFAQVDAAPPPKPAVQRALSPEQQMQARYNIAVMEAVFEAAVQHGAQTLRQQMQSVMPDMMLLSGAARARGVRLEGYGVFFDVDVPAIQPTMAWSLKGMYDVNITSAIQSFRSMLQSVSDRRKRDDLDQALRRIELQLGIPSTAVASDPTGMPPPGAVTANTVEAPVASMPRPSLIDDPFAAYEKAVKTALIDAMLDHSGPLEIGPDEWLTIAAHDNEDRRLSPANTYDLATIILKIKGSDLTAFRAGRLTRDEARARVEVTDF